LFHWPVQRDEIAEWLSRHEKTHGLYYTPALFETATATRDNIRQIRAVWADCDTADATARAARLPLPASLVIETSPGKTQHLWLVSSGLRPELATGINLRLAKLTGGDSCWRVNHYLRLPWTLNRKYDPAPLVRITGRTRRYQLEELVAEYPPHPLPADQMTTDEEVWELLRGKSIEAVIELGFVRRAVRFGPPAGIDRSADFWGLLKDMARAGMSESARLLVALECRDRHLRDKIRLGGAWTDAGVLGQVRRAAEAVRSDG
jgi:hypothetical protein